MNEYMAYAIRDITEEIEQPSTFSTPSLNASIGVQFFNVPNDKMLNEVTKRYEMYTPKFDSEITSTKQNHRSTQNDSMPHNSSMFHLAQSTDVHAKESLLKDDRLSHGAQSIHE